MLFMHARLVFFFLLKTLKINVILPRVVVLVFIYLTTENFVRQNKLKAVGSITVTTNYITESLQIYLR